MGATSEQEQPPVLPRRRDGRPSSPEAASDQEEWRQSCYLGWGCVLAAAVYFGSWGFLCMSAKVPPQYSVAITDAAGLDFHSTATGLPAALDPVFNLTVRVTSRGRDEECLNPATSLQVSYLRVPLAGRRVPPGLCAAPWQRKEQTAVARGRSVAVPGFLLDSLAEDLRSGTAVFEVTLMSPRGGSWHVLTCWARIADGAALERPCGESWIDADVPVPQPGHVTGQPAVLVAQADQ
ncbi:hypothetical protein ACP70R_009288 [Stipagrostis hirtigluma subsp. patula]